MNTDFSDQSHAIDKDDNASKRWETIRKRGIDGNADLNSPKRTKKMVENESRCHAIEDVKQSIKIAATKFKTFPERMMEIIDKPNLKQAIYWLPDGSSFALFPYAFTEKVLNVFFQGAKFESFTRKLNRWGFKRVFDDGYDAEAYIYHHPMFKKGRVDLLKNLSGTSNKKKELEGRKETQPKPTLVPLSNSDTEVSVTSSAMMQMPMVNNMSESNTLQHALTPRLSFLVSNQHRGSSVPSVNDLLLEQHQQFLDQQLFQQHQMLLAQLQAARGAQLGYTPLNGPLGNIQELNFLRAQNADRVRLLQRFQQKNASYLSPNSRM